MKGMVRAMPDHPMSPSRRTGILDWVDPLPDWDREELALQGLIASLAAATDVEDYKNVGRRARDLFDQVASKVFDRSMAPTGQDAPGASDGKRMLDYYFKHQLRGASNKELRDFARSLDALANHLTHAENMGRVKAFVSVQGLVMLVRMIQEIQRQREPQDFWLAPD